MDVLKTERYSGTQWEMRRGRRAGREPWGQHHEAHGGRRAGGKPVRPASRSSWVP